MLFPHFGLSETELDIFFEETAFTRMFLRFGLRSYGSRCYAGGGSIYKARNIIRAKSVKQKYSSCGSKVNLSGENSNVIMSGCGDDNPDDERREAIKDYTKSVSRRSDGGASGAGVGNQRAAVLPDQSPGEEGRS